MGDKLAFRRIEDAMHADRFHCRGVSWRQSFSRRGISTGSGRNAILNPTHPPRYLVCDNWRGGLRKQRGADLHFSSFCGIHETTLSLKQTPGQLAGLDGTRE